MGHTIQPNNQLTLVLSTAALLAQTLRRWYVKSGHSSEPLKIEKIEVLLGFDNDRILVSCNASEKKPLSEVISHQVCLFSESLMLLFIFTASPLKEYAKCSSILQQVLGYALNR
jgi:hypothetical protein